MPMSLARNSFYLAQLWEFAELAMFLFSTPAAHSWVSVSCKHWVPRKLCPAVSLFKVSLSLCGNICLEVGNHHSIFGTYSVGGVTC